MSPDLRATILRNAGLLSRAIAILRPRPLPQDTSGHVFALLTGHKDYLPSLENLGTALGYAEHVRDSLAAALAEEPPAEGAAALAMREACAGQLGAKARYARSIAAALRKEGNRVAEVISWEATALGWDRAAAEMLLLPVPRVPGWAERDAMMAEGGRMALRALATTLQREASEYLRETHSYDPETGAWETPNEVAQEGLEVRETIAERVLAMAEGKPHAG